MGAEGQGHPLQPHLVHPHHRQRLQPLKQAVPPLPPGEMVHPVPGGGRHPQQEAGGLQQLPAQGQAHPQPQGHQG